MTTAQPIRLVLHPGKILRLRVVNSSGQPVAKAQVYYESFHRAGFDSDSPPNPQVEFQPRTDSAGRAVWTNAPDAEMSFAVEASGYQRKNDTLIRPDGEEHLITLDTAVNIHGAVTDASSGRPLPHFRVAVGWAELGISNQPSPQWGNIGRFWLDFANGAYQKRIEEYPLGGVTNRGYFLKFLATGYMPVVSRWIAPDESDVQVDAGLKPAVETQVLVYNPDGSVAANVDVGLASPDSGLLLASGGFYHENVHRAESLLITDSKGVFKLPADDSVQSVIVAGEAGYAEASPAALATNPMIHLQPWGRLEIINLDNHPPRLGRRYLIQMDEHTHGAISLDYDSFSLLTSAQDNFTFDRLPPGQRYLIALGHLAAHAVFTGGRSVPFEIRSGETTTLTIGADYDVTVHPVWPAGVSPLPQWKMIAAAKPQSVELTSQNRANRQSFPVSGKPRRHHYPSRRGSWRLHNNGFRF